MCVVDAVGPGCRVLGAGVTTEASGMATRTGGTTFTAAVRSG